MTYLARVPAFLDNGHLQVAYGVPTDGPYQTNPPSPDDIISSIRIDKEGQVRRIRHEEEIDVLEYQILTREIVPTLKPLEEIIRENVFCLWGGELLKRRVVTKQRVAYQRFAYQRFEQVASCSRSELLYTKQRVAYQRFAYQRAISYGTVSDVITGGTEGAVQQGPGIPKDIYSLINHYTDAKDIWENVKMILEGSELTKDDRESQLYDEFEHLPFKSKEKHSRITLNSKFVNNMLPEWSRFITEVKLNRGLKESNFDQLKASIENLIEKCIHSLALLTQSYKSHLPQTNNQLRTSSNARNKATVQDGRVVVQDVRGRYNANNQGKPFQRNNLRGNVVAGNVGDFKLDEDVDISPEIDWALNMDHYLTADECDAFRL
ncbi:hypothetical protein Tco_0993935 [Tanacetum coccineum]